MFLILLALGTSWGLTQPLIKIAVSNGHQPFGLIFWQSVIGVITLGTVRLLQRKPIAMRREHLWFFLLIALTGTVLPHSFSFRATTYLPAGVMAVIISLVPIFTFPLALLMRIDRFSWLRLTGLALGLVGVILLVGPDSLPGNISVGWVLFALFAPLCYAAESNIVSKWGTYGLGPGHVLFGASVMGILTSLPLALATGQFIDPRIEWGAPEYALIASSAIHALVYSGHVWLIGRAGAVFATQVAYVVTATGVVWSMLLLGERYSFWVWGAMGLIALGMTLVRPGRGNRVAPSQGLGNNDPKRQRDGQA
ncbi:DMT family transporter [Shimia gijangensis]|nr:DMT family transporter [Shimia gijangensis]